jgi:hypothetical protein
VNLRSPKDADAMNIATLVFLAAASAPAAPPQACTAPEHRQFDFWIGKWDVFDAKSGARAGASQIELLYGACVIRENWSEPGFAGGSLNIYADGKWRQTWVDQSGSRREFEGGVSDGKMILVARVHRPQAPDKTFLVRMTFTKNGDGTVRQFSDYSKNDGATWAFRYDYIYKPAAP